MKLVDWMEPEQILCQLRVETLEEALLRLLERAPGVNGLAAEGQKEKCARDLAFGSRGEVVRVHSHVVAVIAEQDGLSRPVALLAIGAGRFRVSAEGKEPPGEARAAVLFLVPTRPSAFRARVVPVLRRFLASDEVVGALLEARDAAAVLAVEGLATLRFPEHPQVGEAVVPATYRVYPESSVEELVDLMVRRELHAVPVVGEGYEVLGIVTTGDALAHLLGSAGAGGAGGTAREIMTRAVLCVTEDQELRDVAQLMVNRDVEQLPVVREGQLVGLVTRDSVLSALFGADGEPG